MTARWVVCVCVAALAIAGGCSSTATSPQRPSSAPNSSGRIVGGTKQVSLADWATVRIPRRWIVTPFEGAPATVYFPLDFVSSAPLPPACRSGANPLSCQGPNWFAPGWTTPARGVLILWARVEIPGTGPVFAHLPGRDTTIDHRPAKRQSGRPDTCPADTATEIDAMVLAGSAATSSGDRIDMHACLAANTTREDRAAVRDMLTSLRIRAHE